MQERSSVSLCLVCSFVVLATRATASDEVDFARDVRPVLSNICFKCHGPDEETREADLRLDTAQGAAQDLGGYRAIVPGDPAASALVERISSDDESLKMPPPDSGMELTKAQIGLLTQWVREGAVYKQHWAFQPILRPDVPMVEQAPWCRNPIDRFVVARLDRAGITPSPEADRRTLIRRVFLDLQGLPPTPDEVKLFLDDASPDAYERMVQRALASPHFGERWGRHWLDQARYADTNGYTIDSERTIWPYRDWVIDALNRDVPFDQFTIEQLAGDQLPDASLSQQVATGFHRNTLVNQEGGVDHEQFRNEAVMNRVDTTGAVWLGLTIGCARCHNHKYDPISQRDYYQLFAFFNSGQDVNSVAPVVRVATAEQQERLTKFDREIAAARQRLADYDRARNQRLPESSRDDGKPVEWTALGIDEFASEAGAAFEKLGDGSLLVTGTNGDTDVYTVVTTSPLKQITAIRLEVLTHPSLPKGGPGRAGNGNFVLNEIELEVGGNRSPAWLHAAADHSQKDYDVTAAIDGDITTGWAINVSSGRMNVNRTSRFILHDAVDLEATGRLVVRMRFGDKPPKYNIGRFRVAVTDAPHVKLDLPDPARARLAAEIKSLESSKTKYAGGIPSTMVMRDLDEPRDTFVLTRGDFLRHGDQVAPDVPQVLPPLLDSREPRTRLDLARWLVSRKNPLTARVLVNRIWMRLFGQGLVETENDFGIQGAPPTHPELLDWLAADMMEAGWSLKHVLQVIVTSATYRQSSRARPDLLELDPSNKLLARQMRLRVDAEIIRDLGLAASGLLDRRVGGPSVRPPQPEGVYAFTQRAASWKTSTGPNRYRRGMYTFFMRSAPYPMLTTFDTPKFNNTCTRRMRSNTPIQALTMANDQVMMEIARALGRKLVVSRDEDDERLRYAFELCFSRLPDRVELERLGEYLEKQRAAFTEGEERAGDFAGDQWPAELPAKEAAAWTAVSRLLINLDEFITRE